MATRSSQDSSNPVEAFWGLLFISLSCIGLTGLLQPMFGHNSVSIVSNLKQIGRGVNLYTVDCDQRLPFVEPYEFGFDPLGPYLNEGQGDSLHENAIKVGLGDERKPKTTQHEFRFAFAPMVIEESGLTRRIVDLIKAKKPESIPIAWSDIPLRKRRIVLLYADSHVKGGLPESFRQEFSPTVVTFVPALRGRLNFLPKENAEWPPPTWSLPASQVAEFARQVKP